MRNFILLCFVSLLGFSQAQATGPNLLTNGDFEEGFGGVTPPPGAGGWIAVEGPNFFVESLGNFNTPAADADHGSFALKLFGSFFGVFNQVIAFQDMIPATPGDLYEACVEAQTLSADMIMGSNQGFVRLVFFDAMGNEISGFNSPTLTAASPADEWIDLCVSEIAPVGAATAGIFVFFQQLDGVSPGSIFYDNASLCATPAAAIPTLETWGLIILGLGLSIVGIVYLAQRKSAIQVG